MKLEYADARRKQLPDGCAARLAQTRALLDSGILCGWCNLAPASIRRHSAWWCRGCATADRIVRKHQQERG